MAEISPGRRCAAKYPIVLIHGAGFRDLKWPLYWGRIPGALEKNGALVRYGLQDSWGSIESNAQMIARRIDAIDLRRAPLTRRSGDGVRDICEVYLQIAEDLKNRGF